MHYDIIHGLRLVPGGLPVGLFNATWYALFNFKFKLFSCIIVRHEI